MLGLESFGSASESFRDFQVALARSAHLITETWAPPPLSPNAIRPSLNVHRHYGPRGAYAQLHLCLSSIRTSGPGHHVCAVAQMHRVAVQDCNPKRWFCPTEFMNTIDARYRVAKQPACRPHRPSSPPDRLSRLDSSSVIASPSLPFLLFLATLSRPDAPVPLISISAHGARTSQ